MTEQGIYNFYIPKYMDLGVGSLPNKVLYNYYVDYVILKKEFQVLEIGFGTGLLTIPLLKNSIKVIALDKSVDNKLFIDKKCQEYIQANKLQIEAIDILEYNSTLSHSTILAIDEFLTHFLTISELDLFLKKISELLRLGGEFITDIRIKKDDELTKLNCYPVYTLREEIDGVKYIRCTSWNNLIDGNILLVNYKYEEMDSSGKIINSFIKILKQGMISFENLRILATKNSLSLSIKNEFELDCSILQFIKIK